MPELRKIKDEDFEILIKTQSSFKPSSPYKTSLLLTAFEPLSTDKHGKKLLKQSFNAGISR